MSKYVDTAGETPAITQEGYELLKGIVTDPYGQAYAFLPTANPMAAAASMARLSRSQNDLRVIYLQEFAGNEQGIDKLVRRVVTEYGDDSVQQLLCLHVVVESTSNLGTKQLELGRLMSYLEQSTRYIYFDRKANGRYKYFVPPELQGATLAQYTRCMDAIFDNYSAMVRGVTDYVRGKSPAPPEPENRQAWLNATRAQACDAVRPVLPVSTQSTVGIVGSVQAFDNMIMRLLSEDIPEFQELGAKILAEVRKVAPVFFERTDLPDRGGAKSRYRRENRNRMREIADRLGLREPKIKLGGRMPENGAALVDYWPESELDLADNCLSEFTRDTNHLSLNHRIQSLDREQRVDILKAYIGERLNRRHKPGRAFEKAHYEWEITGDYGTFRDLQRHRMVDAWTWPELTPSHGYEVPELVVEAGFKALYDECFGISHSLYWRMYENSYMMSAQYATLLGHRMRYRFIHNAREAYHLFELRTTPQGHPGYRKIARQMHERLAQVHPIIAAGMWFVGKKDSPELTRMDSELAIARKLGILGEG